jgi:hypothetical protein
MLASGRPILAATDPNTELHDLLHGSAIIVPPGDPSAMTNAVKVAIANRADQSTEPSKLVNLFSSETVLPGLHRELCSGINNKPRG